MRNRRFHRRSGSATKVRTFWVRNTGALSVISGVNAAQATLFDPLAFLPDPVTQRVDINRDVTILTTRFNYTCTFHDENGIAHTNFLTDFYCGININERTATSRSPSFTTADDARTDWLDCWMDSALAPAANAVAASAATFQDVAGGNHRHLKTKRKLTSEQLLVFSSSKPFPHDPAAILAQNFELLYQWQVSVLLRVG